MHLFERAYSISNSALLRNCCKRLKDSADWFSASFVITALFFSSCFCFLGNRMGTGRGDQGVLSEQRQNRGNLHHAPNYNTSRPHCLAYREAIFDIFWLSWRGPRGPRGRALRRAAISDPSIKCCFSCSEERGQKGRERKCAQESLGWDSQKDFLSNISDDNWRDQFSCFNDFCKN